MNNETLEFKKGEIICRQNENTSDLYFIESGKALVFGVEGTKVTPFAYIKEKEFIGELSFLDGKSRSAYTIAQEDSQLIKIAVNCKDNDMPNWLLNLSVSIASRIRKIDDIIMKKGIRRKNTDSIEPLTIEEQREILEKIK